ncbi:PA14 domain-containing protein [Streptomyces pseudovenezuelae]|uniref:PA14 domain-containing protein n=1 Tax=Streptomyces pseudovenezuelae TaxID=67350 RepID=UPI002E361CB9|nr:PA14 domain-containing protein [Streptomyces pseudovenezuelae]
MKSARRTTAAAVVLATAGTLFTAGAAPASAAVNCASPVFKRQFYANTSLSGTPKKTDCDNAIDQSWSGAPVTGLPKDNFAVRWTVTRDFGSGGPFALDASGLDGIRVYVDGVRRIDLWKNVSTTVAKAAAVTVPSGTHTLRVDYVNWTGAAKVKVSYAPRTSADVDKVKPLTPTGTSVSYDRSTRRAKVVWSGNKEMDLAGYQVYRRLKGTSYGTKPLTTTTSTSYTDTPPPTGATYYYEVRARDKAGNTSGGTADQPVTTVDTTPPAAPFLEMDACPVGQPYAAPELVTTAENAADIALYEMQRLNPATNSWVTVYTGARGAICDTGQIADGSKVTYRGRARDAVGNWSAYSAATTFTTFDLTPPATAADARVEYRSGVPHVVWSAVDGAARYEVLQYDQATGGWLDALPGTAGTTTQTDVVPRQLVAVADSYRYAVRAQDTRGNASAPVEAVLDMADRPEAIAPYETTATRSGEGVHVSWASADPWTNDGAPLLTYRIERTDPLTGETVVVDKCKPGSPFDEPLEAPSVSWSWASDGAPAYAGRKVLYGTCWDVGGASETTYEYRVVTVDPYGHTSQPGPAATETWPDTKRPDPVQNLTAEQIPLGVRLTWTPPADDDVRGYRVWEGVTNPETGDTQWKENCWTGSSLARTEILCPILPDGSTHTYKVAATDGSPFIDEYAGPAALHPAELSVTLPDTRPPGWTGTTVREDQYPTVDVGCEETDDLGDCARLTDYRVERWDPERAAYVTLHTAEVGTPTLYVDYTVHEDVWGLYYYRVVFTDSSGTEQAVRQQAYGIWESWL